MITKTTEVENMDLSQVFRYVDRRLATKAGINRFRWNLQQKGAWSSSKNRRFKNGPLVAPGMYTVQLKIGEQSFKQTFEIKIDPRVAAEGITVAAIENQIAMQQKVMNLLSESRKLQAQLEKDTSNKAQIVLKKLKNGSGAYPQQMFVSQVSYLLNMISNADQKPGAEAQKRFLELTNQFKMLKQALQ